MIQSAIGIVFLARQIIGIIGYYDLVSMTLITMQAGAPNDSVPPLPVLAK